MSFHGKHLWALAQKKDRIWIKWVHCYYIKQRNVLDMELPKQCSWVVRKIMGVRDYVQSLQNGQEWLRKNSFSIQRMYRTMMGPTHRVQWAKMLCQNVAPPKCIFTVWLLMQGKLPTYSYLQRVGVQVDQWCCLCGNEEETLEHLFFGCSVSTEVYGSVMAWCGVQRIPEQWTEEKLYMMTQCTNNNRKQKLYRGVVTILVYHIWNERNRRRMQGKRNLVEEIVRRCKVMSAWCARKDRKLAQLTFCN